MKKLIIALFALLLLTSCGQKTIVSPVREEIKATATNLGAKKSDSKPIILINDSEDTLYIGETDFNFNVEAYSNNGEVTITFDDSAVDFNTANSYQVKVLATDPFEQSEDNTDLILKKKPIIQANTVNSESGSAGSGTENSSSVSGSNGTSGCYKTEFGKNFCSWAEFLAYVDEMHAIGGLSDSNWEKYHAYSDWPEAYKNWPA